MPIIAIAQSPEADNLYNKGVELYNAEQYEQAVKYFVQSDSLEKAQLDPSSQLYYRSELALASAYGNIAVDHYNNGNYNEALRLGNIVADTQKKALGEQHPDYAMTLDNLALFNAASGKLDDAILLEKKALEIRKQALGEQHADYASSLSNLADFYSGKGNFNEAFSYGNKALEIRKNTLGEQHPDYAQSLNNLATYNYYIGNYDEAIRLGNLALDIWRQVLGEAHPYYAQSLGNLADYNSKIGNYNEAIKLATKTTQIFKQALGEGHPTYAKSLNNLASYYYYVGKYSQAIQFGTTAMQIQKQVLGENHPEYAQTLNSLAEYNSKIGKYNEAISLGNQATEIIKAAYGEQHPDYAQMLSNFAGYNAEMGNYAQAISSSKKATDVLRRALGDGHSDYAKALINLAGHYSKMGDYSEAIKIGEQATEIIRNAFGDKHPEYALAIDNLANYNFQAGNTTKAIELSTLAMNIKKQALGANHPDYATSLNNLASYHAANANFNDAIKLQNSAIAIRSKALGTKHPDYATSIANLASYYSAIGNYNEAIRLGKTALDIRKNTLGEQHPDYAKSLLSLADFNSKSGNKDEAVRLVTLAMEIDRNSLGDNHPAYAASLSNLAVYYSEMGNYKEAIRLASIAMQIDEYNVGSNHPDFAASMSNLAVYYSSDGNYKEAIRLETAAAEIRRKTLGEDHPHYARSINNLAAYNLYIGNYEAASQQLNIRYNLTNTYVLKNFSTMTAQERTNFWNIHSVFFSNTLPLAAYKHPNPTSNMLAYNGQLFSKGLLLNAELEIQKLIEKSGDKNFADKWNKIRSDRATLDNLYQQPTGKRLINADSLAAVIEREEKELVESSKELGDYTRDLSINWQDIQSKLTDTDVAIEFANFVDEDKLVYVAIVLKKGMEAPELVKISTRTTDSTAYYTNSDLYNGIWQPLQKYITGVKNVYFAPSGKLHSIAIEYLPDDSGEIFAQKYNAYRLTSTRELALQRPSNPEKKAAVYGGIVYQFSKGDWQDLKDSKDEIVAEFRDIPDFDDEDSTQRAGIGFLKGAQIEAEEVTDILREGEYLVSEGSDVNATEESFKKLSGSGVKIMHIATHGFYEPEGKKKSFADYLTKGNQNSKEDLSLSRSGLFLAGAASAIDPKKRKDIPEGVDDGILTAKEISRLDFQGLDLVVLSACQTGLGAITGEGVFGLQRGFKKAGAKTIIMSLWKVDDAATKDLMTDFYRNLTNGMSKRESFMEAQELLRTKYKDPRKWAAFIMVDGQ